MDTIRSIEPAEFGANVEQSEMKGFIRTIVTETLDFLFQDPVTQGDAAVGRSELSRMTPRAPLDLDLAHAEYSRRRLRDSIFGTKHLFGEPAWDMLLDLFVMEQSGKKVSISSACIGSCVAPTTALRWIQALENEGLVFKVDDKTDRRRSFVKLTTAANLKIREYLSSIHI